MAIDFDNLNDFTRRTPVILSAADVLDWSEKMTTMKQLLRYIFGFIITNWIVI